MAETFPKGHISQWRELVGQARLDPRFDSDLSPEVQTDKELVKIVPCQLGCNRPLIVTTFYVLAWAKCGPCKGESEGPREPGSLDVVQAGSRTDPKLAKDLTKCLINPGFATAICPAHPDDPEHEMELKHVHHTDNYGPVDWRIIDGKLTPVQVAPGEVVLHQCVRCNAIVSYNTTAVTQFKRMNEPVTHSHKQVNRWLEVLGPRQEEPPNGERKAYGYRADGESDAPGEESGEAG